MSLEMVPVEIVGLKADISDMLKALQTAGSVHIDDLADMPEISARPFTLEPGMLSYQEELTFLVARIGGILDTMGGWHLPPAECPGR